MERGVVGWLLIIGVTLFVFPEPATSGLGMTIIGLGIVIWLSREIL